MTLTVEYSEMTAKIVEHFKITVCVCVCVGLRLANNYDFDMIGRTGIVSFLVSTFRSVQASSLFFLMKLALSKTLKLKEKLFLSYQSCHCQVNQFSTGSANFDFVGTVL